MKTLYEYSQFCCIVEALILGLALLRIGNDKIQSIHWLKRAKWAIFFVLLIVGVLTSIQYIFNTSSNNQTLDIALNISSLCFSTIIIYLAFVPLAIDVYVTRSRLLSTCLVFAVCILLVWLALPLNRSVSNILIVASLSIYFVELVRIILVFLYNYKTLTNQNRQAGNEEDPRYTCLKRIMNCIILLSSFALIYIFLVMISVKFKAIYNFAMLLVWAYLFVTLVNLIIDYHPVAEEINIFSTTTEEETAAHFTQDDLAYRVDQWIASGSYRIQGITMVQIAEQLSTNRIRLSRFINARYECSFNTWLNQLRVEDAKRHLLSSPNLSIDKISLKVGFASKSHFMSVFKSVEGMTPGKWRDSHLQ